MDCLSVLKESMVNAGLCPSKCSFLEINILTPCVRWFRLPCHLLISDNAHFVEHYPLCYLYSYRNVS